MKTIQADQLLPGNTLLTIPHFDDEILGCGGTLNLLSDKSRIHLLFVTKGDSLPISTKNPQTLQQDICETRKAESIKALRYIGIPEENVHFLNIPEGLVHAHRQLLADTLTTLIREIAPETVLTPFRYDQHKDHIALNRVTHRCCRNIDNTSPTILEYFIYFNYPLFPKKDIRKYCVPDNLIAVDITSVSARKIHALNLFASQTTLFYPEQCRPVLSQSLIKEYSTGQEIFFSARQVPSMTIPTLVIRTAQQLQPRLKKIKEHLRYFLSKKKSKKS